MAKSIMIQGTASGVGKTILTIALCRILKQDGIKAAPFKAQNMTANTCVTNDSEEIAVSQWLQAAAAGTEPCADMNPVILKPLSEQKSTQIILNGKNYNTIDAYKYSETRQKLTPEILSAYSRLANKYDVIIIEGAGSPVELNLNRDDMINMGVAIKVKAPVVIVSDIDRGGIFASLYGTVRLLKETERMHVKALIVNRFKGELSFFTDGAEILERITGIPVAGVIPYRKIDLPEEDSLYGGGTPFGKKADFENQFNSIADNVRKSLNMDLIYKIINEGIKQ